MVLYWEFSTDHSCDCIELCQSAMVRKDGTDGNVYALFISTVLIVGILSQMLSLTGPVNHLIENLGGQAIHFMGEPKLFKTLYVFSDVWQKTGYNAVIYISALAAVDQELHEAATVDGANIWQRIRYIDIPSIMPTAVILLIMSCGHILTIGYEKYCSCKMI